MGSDTESERLVRPPALRTGWEASASRLELFFDLAYVLVVFELAGAFLKDLTWSGLGTFGALFVAVWTSWVGYTLYANRFDTDDVLFRVAKLAATLSIAGCAAAASAATSSFSTPFAVSFLASRVILLLLHARAWRHIPDARPTIGVYLATIAAGSVLWTVSLPFDGPVRYWLWAAAVIVDAAGPVIATWRDNHLPLHMEHLPERFGLFVILVLGEAVGGAATGVHDAKWAASAVAVAVAGFVLAAALWWSYFDTTAASSAVAPSPCEDVEPDADRTRIGRTRIGRAQCRLPPARSHLSWVDGMAPAGPITPKEESHDHRTTRGCCPLAHPGGTGFPSGLGPANRYGKADASRCGRDRRAR